VGIFEIEPNSARLTTLVAPTDRSALTAMGLAKRMVIIRPDGEKINAVVK